MGNSLKTLDEANPESVEVAKYAAGLVMNNLFSTIDKKSKEKGAEPERERPQVGSRPIPSPLQDDNNWDEPTKQAEQSLQSPEAIQMWPQTPQSPVAPAPPMPALPPMTQESFNAGFAAGFNQHFGAFQQGAPCHGFAPGYPGYPGAGALPVPGVPGYGGMLGQAAMQGYGGCAPQPQAYGQGYGYPYAHYGSYQWQGGCNYGYPPVNQGPVPDMRQAYYPQAQTHWNQGGQTAFFQPFSTQPPAPAAAPVAPVPLQPPVQHFAPPPAAPAYPPQNLGPVVPAPAARAPLTAQFSQGPFSTQPFQQAGFHPPTAPPAAPPLAPTAGAPPAPPRAAPNMAARESANDDATKLSKEERRHHAAQVMSSQRRWLAMLAAGADEVERRSEASTAVTTPPASASSSSEPKPEAPAAEQAQAEKPRELEKETSSSKAEGSKVSTPTKQPWAPRIAPRKGNGKGGVWIAKDSANHAGKGAKGGAKGSGKGAKGKGKNGNMVYRPKAEQEVAETQRRTGRRGKMGSYSYGY